jgi:hypothetical protein
MHTHEGMQLGGWRAAFARPKGEGQPKSSVRCEGWITFSSFGHVSRVPGSRRSPNNANHYPMGKTVPEPRDRR